jgi:cellulose synthase operon protein YhjQ
MTDRKRAGNRNEGPEDGAIHSTWANLHGAKYRDFSASRAQARENERLRVEQTVDEQGLIHLAAEGAGHQQEFDAQAALVAEEAAEHEAREAARLLAERAAQHVAEQAAQEAAQRSAEQAARVSGEQSAQRTTELAAQRAVDEEFHLAAQRAALRAAEQVAKQRAWEESYEPAPPAVLSSTPSQPAYVAPGQSAFESLGYAPAVFRPAASPPVAFPAAREENYTPASPAWTSAEPAGRPAWLVTERLETPAAQPPVQAVQLPAASISTPLPQAPEDTLQGSRDRMTSRWFALRSVFEPGAVPAEAAPAPVVMRAPVMAIFSLAGGVGKTSMVATLGRALSARGERVLLVDTAAFGLLPFFFGARDQRPGMLRTFNPPGVSSDAPIQLLTLDPESLGPESAGQEPLTAEILKLSRGASRVLVDLATASGSTTRRILRMNPTVLVPVTADMSSVVSVSSIDAFFDHNGAQAGKSTLPYYVLNQFDPSVALHLDVREVLREQLGERLLPFALHRAAAMSEALAEGMTVMDYAPNSSLAEDFATLAAWVKGLSAPASTSYRGVRWSER